MNETAKEAQEDKRNASPSETTEGTTEAPRGAFAEAEAPPAAPEGDTGPSETGRESATDVVERLATAEAEIADLRDKYARSLAETENVRRRAARDRADASKYAISAFAGDLLSVADNLRRAIDSVEAEARRRDPMLDALVGGVEMTEKELLTVFERYGIAPIEAEGQRFDPHVHEAMFEIPDESVPSGTVVRVMQPGYRIHDRTLRPARVGVSKGGPKPGIDSDQPTETDPDGEEKVTYLRSGSTSAYEKQADPRERGDSSGSRVDETL